MPKIVAPLNVTRINAAKPGPKVIKLSDGGGLALWVMPNGRKVWRVQYRRPHDGKLDTITLGPYPEVSLADARCRREQVRADLSAGNDPKQAVQHRDEAKRHAEGANFQSVAAEWWARWKDEVTQSYAAQVWRVLETNVFPDLGKRPIASITARHIVDALSPMEARGALEYLRRAKQVVTQIMGYALARGLVANNVAAGINGAFSNPKRENFRAMRPDGLPLLVKGIESNKINLQTRLLIEWQLLTLSRPGEAAGTTWDEIDGDLWTIPAERMKRRREHIVPLSKAALAILEQMRPISGRRRHVFPGRNDQTTHTNEGTANVSLKRLGIPTTAHGLRALASTTLNEAGFDPNVIEVALAHVDQNATRAAYNRALYLDQRREMLEWWADKVAAAKSAS